MTEKISHLDRDVADDLLEKAIHQVLSESVPEDVRERAVDAAAHWMPAPQLGFRRRWLLRGSTVAAIAAMLLASFCAGRFMDADKVSVSQLAKSDTPEVDAQRSDDLPTNSSPAGAVRPNVALHVAANSAIIAANGGHDPIHLGAWIPYRELGNFLHVWDWSKSPLSRVVPQARLLMDDCIAASPTGELLVWASGSVLNLGTGQRSNVDLGGASYRVAGQSVRRILEMRFLPDGQNLALRVARVSTEPSQHPLRTTELTATEYVQIVEFPSGKLKCEFLAGDRSNLRFSASADGGSIFCEASPTSARQVIQRNLSTGDVVRQFEPQLKRRLSTIDLSKDGRLLAACENDGDLFIWEAASGKLIHQLSSTPPFGHLNRVLRFSPDAKYLAFFGSPFGGRSQIHVIDVSSGKIIRTLHQTMAVDMRWSPDGNTITVITPLAHSAQTDPLYNIYPAIHQWDWRSGAKIQSIEANRPETAEGARASIEQ